MVFCLPTEKKNELGQFIFGNAYFLWVAYGLILMETFGFYCMLENNKILEKNSASSWCEVFDSALIPGFFFCYINKT